MDIRCDITLLILQIFPWWWLQTPCPDGTIPLVGLHHWWWAGRSVVGSFKGYIKFIRWLVDCVNTYSWQSSASRWWFAGKLWIFLGILHHRSKGTFNLKLCYAVNTNKIQNKHRLNTTAELGRVIDAILTLYANLNIGYSTRVRQFCDLLKHYHVHTLL